LTYKTSKQESLQDIRQGEKHLNPASKQVLREDRKQKQKQVKEQKMSTKKSKARTKSASDMPELGFYDA